MTRLPQSLRPRNSLLPIGWLLWGLCAASGKSLAVDRIVIEAARLSSPAAQIHDLEVVVDLKNASARAHATKVQFPAGAQSWTDLSLECSGLDLELPRLGCGSGAVRAGGGPVGPLSARARVSYDTLTSAAALSEADLEVAGATARFSGTWNPRQWTLKAQAGSIDLARTRAFASRWVTLPPGYSVSGKVNLVLQAAGPATGKLGRTLRAQLALQSAGIDFSNEAGTTVGQKLALSISARTRVDPGRFQSEVRLQGGSGQALAGPVLLDLALNPLDLRAHLTRAGSSATWAVDGIQMEQNDLVHVTGEAVIATNAPYARTAHLDFERLESAAAYRTFLQLALATTDFGALIAGGESSGQLDFADDRLRNLSVRLRNISLADPNSRLTLANANGEIHWISDEAAPVQTSHVSWSSSSAYGLIGGPVELDFETRGLNLALHGDTRFPVFDGALIVHKLAGRHLGTAGAELDFDAHLEPISMPLLSRSFGWPELSGSLGGRIPGVTYRDQVLAVEGDLSANVFDGTIVARGLKLRDPFGPWPRLEADVNARRLDLDLLTHTFSIGSITGRLDADVSGLQLFNWTPVAFDARLQTTPGDDSRHLISQKAVTSISNVGGGGGGVAAALQSGVLRFFDTFHYDRIGIRCQLRQEVCLMSGLTPARQGYYLVKGKGLPRIDIIGNAGRVDWPQLVAQIAAGMRSQDIIVR